MVGAAGGAQEAGEAGVVRAHGQRGLPRQRQAEVDDVEAPDGAGGRGQEVGAPGAGEGDRAVGGQDGAGDGAVVDPGAAGQVDGQDPEGPLAAPPGPAQGGDELGGGAAQGFAGP